MKRLFVTFCLLSLCVLPASDISHSQQTVSVVTDDKPIRFKVCVYVTPNYDTDLDERIETLLRRELRALGDVDLVKIDSDWHFFLAYDIEQHTFKDGTNTGLLSIGETLLSSHPRVTYKTYGLPKIGKPAFFVHIIVGYWSADNLHEFAIQAIGLFDKDTLESYRKN